MSSGAPSPAAIQPDGSPPRADENGADGESSTNGASGSASVAQSDGEKEEKEEEGSRRRSSRRATIDVSRRVQTPTLGRRTNTKPNSTASQKKNTPANPPARAPSPPVESVPTEVRNAGGSTINDDDEVENELAVQHASSPHTQPSTQLPAAPSPPTVAPVVAPAAVSPPARKLSSSPLPEPIARTTRTPSASLVSNPHQSASATPSNNHPIANGRASGTPSGTEGSARKVSGTPKPLKIVEQGGREVIELSDDEMDGATTDIPQPVIVKKESTPPPPPPPPQVDDDGGEDLDDEDEDDEDDEEDEDDEDDEDDDDDDDGEGGPNGDQSEGVEGDDEDDEEEGDDDDEGAMQGVEVEGQGISQAHAFGGPITTASQSTLIPNLLNPAPLSSSQLPTDPSASVNVLNPHPAASLLPTNAEAGPSSTSLLPVNAPLIPVKKTRKRRTPSPSPPPALKKPDITLRLDVVMGKGKGAYTEFSLYEKAFEQGVYDEEVMSIWSIRGQKEEEIKINKEKEEEIKRAETEEEAMARMLEEKYGKEDAMARPKKRRRRRKDDNEYDVGDPFIDDSTAGIDAPEFQGVPLQEGFFVHVGAVKLKEVEAPEPKPRGRGRPRASDAGPAAKRVKLDGTPMSPASGTDYPGGAAGSPSADQLGRRALASPEPDPPKPEISPEVEEGFVHLKEEVSKCDWSNKAKFPQHMKPILAELAQKAIRTDCYTQPFFDRMPDIFPYNKFTITKLIKKENHPYYDNFLKEKRANLVTAFKKEVQVVVDERLESHKEAVQQWEEQQKAKLESEKDGLDPSTPPPAPSPAPVPNLQPSSFIPLANRSATPEPIPATLPGGGDGDDGPAGGSEKPPTKKFTFSYEMKQLLWQLHLVLVQTMEAQNDVNKYTGQAEMQLTSLNKGLYAELVTCFPPGYMTTTGISRQLSSMKDADKKKKDRHAEREAANAKGRAEWEEMRAARKAQAAAELAAAPPAVTGWAGGQPQGQAGLAQVSYQGGGMGMGGAQMGMGMGMGMGGGGVQQHAPPLFSAPSGPAVGGGGQGIGMGMGMGMQMGQAPGQGQGLLDARLGTGIMGGPSGASGFGGATGGGMQESV